MTVFFRNLTTAGIWLISGLVQHQNVLGISKLQTVFRSTAVFLSYTQLAPGTPVTRTIVRKQLQHIFLTVYNIAWILTDRDY